MQWKPATCLLALVSVLSMCSSALAHHSVSEYDSEHPIVLKGTVTEFAWQNPHIELDLDVKDDDGAVVHWICLAASPARMAKFGWTADSVKPGEQVTVGLQPAKNGSHVGAFIKVSHENGEVVGGSKQ